MLIMGEALFLAALSLILMLSASCYAQLVVQLLALENTEGPGL